MARTTDVDRDFALIGAAAKVKELQAEIDAIYQRYPDLRLRRRALITTGGTTVSKKRSFSKTGRRAISEGMRKYWARRKAQQAAKGAKAGRAAS